MRGEMQSGAKYKKSNTQTRIALFVVVEVTGLEPTTSWSRTKRATKLRYTSIAQAPSGARYLPVQPNYYSRGAPPLSI